MLRNVEMPMCLVDWVKQNMNKIDWEEISSNESSGATQLLEKNQDKIDWGQLSLNESAQ